MGYHGLASSWFVCKWFTWSIPVAKLTLVGVLAILWRRHWRGFKHARRSSIRDRKYDMI
jgi:hypothetical protein